MTATPPTLVARGAAQALRRHRRPRRVRPRGRSRHRPRPARPQRRRQDAPPSAPSPPSTRCDEGEVRVAGHDVRRDGDRRAPQAIGLVGQTTGPRRGAVRPREPRPARLGCTGSPSAEARRAWPTSSSRRVRPRGRRRPEGVDVLRRHAPPARHRRQPDPPAAPAVPRRADHRAGPARPRPRSGRACARWSADGTTVLLTTQYLDEADQLADRITVMGAGRVDRRGHLRRAQETGSAATG